MKTQKHLRSLYTHRAIKILLALGLFALIAYSYFVMYPYLKSFEGVEPFNYPSLVIFFVVGGYAAFFFVIAHTLNNRFIYNTIPERQLQAVVIQKLTQEQIVRQAADLSSLPNANAAWGTTPVAKYVSFPGAAEQGVLLFKTDGSDPLALLVPFSVFDHTSVSDSGVLRYKQNGEEGKFIAFEKNAAAA